MADIGPTISRIGSRSPETIATAPARMTNPMDSNAKVYEVNTSFPNTTKLRLRLAGNKQSGMPNKQDTAKAAPNAWNNMGSASSKFDNTSTAVLEPKCCDTKQPIIL